MIRMGGRWQTTATRYTASSDLSLLRRKEGYEPASNCSRQNGARQANGLPCVTALVRYGCMMQIARLALSTLDGAVVYRIVPALQPESLGQTEGSFLSLPAHKLHNIHRIAGMNE